MIKITSLTVESVLKANEDARNSDSLMIIDILNRAGASLTRRQMDIIREISFESLRRTRQKYQAAGQYEPTDEKVRKARGFKALQVQQRINQTGAHRTKELIDEQVPLL